MNGDRLGDGVDATRPDCPYSSVTECKSTVAAADWNENDTFSLIASRCEYRSKDVQGLRETLSEVYLKKNVLATTWRVTRLAYKDGLGQLGLYSLG